MLSFASLEEGQKWNKMWDLWVTKKAASPYGELMTYYSEVNNGGHYQYFDNVANVGDLQKEMSALETVLPTRLRRTLQIAYKLYLVLEKRESAIAGLILEKCDDTFYGCEEELNRILKEYASTIDL